MLERYHRLDHVRSPLPTGQTVLITRKPGLRERILTHPGVALLLERAELAANHLLDASGSAGLVALAATHQGAARVTVLESSRAALTCLCDTFRVQPNVQVAAGLPWDAPVGVFDRACLLPTTDRGSARVLAELQGVHAALAEGGVAYVVMSKDEGGKRYEKAAAALFGELTVVAKAGGWRLSRVVKRQWSTQPAPSLTFKAAGLELSAEPGVFAAGKLDPGTSLLLDTFDMAGLAGRRVLDLGCGYGVLALKASLAGAAVTALDDDLAAVRSTYRNAQHYGLDVRTLHADVNSELAADERFDVVLTNPPFHVGKQVVLEVPRAFLAAALLHLVPGGRLVLVANHALAYEAELAPFAEVHERARDRRFKVLEATKS